MIARIYSVKDELSGRFHNPMFLGDSPSTEAEAIRIFKTQLENTTVWKANPEDFSLFQIGAMDDTTGLITTELTKITGGRAVERKEE